MPISQREAAKQWGKSRATIQRHIAAGKLSATRDADGNNTLDPAELQRLYGPPKVASTAPLDTPPVPGEPEAIYRHNKELMQAQIDLLKAENVALKANLTDLREAMQRLPYHSPRRSWWPWSKA